MLGIGVVLLALSLKPAFMRSKDWREKVGLRDEG
jgi:hypothetical protein